jgi:hypothetical protein
MTTLIEQMRGWMDRVVIRVSALVDPPLAADAKPIEVQRAIVDEMELRTEPIGGGRRVLPYDHVLVTALAPGKDERAALQAALGDVQEAIRLRLREMRCDLPSGFAVSVRYVKQAPSGWTPDQRFALACQAPDAAGRPQDAPVAIPALQLTVVRGRTVEPAYTFTERRLHIGRTGAPVDSSGQVRQNHVAFLDDPADEHSQSVGRAHASIHYQPGRQVYQLFDDGSRNGTRVVREGTTLDVVRRDPVGITIQSGDELQFGTAAVRIRIDGRP